MTKFKRYLSIILVITLFITIVPNFFNLNNYKTQISKKIYELTNYHLIINGDIKLFILPKLQIKVKDAKLLKNLDDELALINIESLSSVLKISSLFKKTLKIEEIIVDRPKINIGYSAKIFSKNLAKASDTQENLKNSDKDKIVFDFNKLVLSNAEINYKIDDEKFLLLSNLNFNAQRKDNDADIDIEFKNNELNSNIKLKIYSILNLINNEIDSDFSFNIELNKKSYQKILAAEFKGHLKKDSNKLFIKSNISSNNSDLFELFRHKVYNYKADNSYLPKISFTKQNKYNDNNSDNSGLDLDLDLKLNAKNIIYKSVSIDEIDSHIELHNNNLKIVQDKIVIAGGTASNIINVANINANLPKINTEFKAENISLNKLFKDYKVFTNFGKTNLDFNFNSIGTDKDTIISNINGSGSLLVKSGEIIDLPVEFNSVANLVANKNIDKIIFDSIKGNFNINNGIARSENLEINSDIAHITGTGSINLNNNEINYKLIPISVLNYQNSQNLGIKVFGKPSNLKYSIFSDKNTVNKIMDRIDKKNPKLKNFLENNLGKALELIK